MSYHKLLCLNPLIILLTAVPGLCCFLCGLCLLAESEGYSLVSLRIYPFLPSYPFYWHIVLGLFDSSHPNVCGMLSHSFILHFSHVWAGEGNGTPLQYSCLENPMDCSLPGSSIHGIFQARVLEWGAIAFSSSNMREVQNKTMR